MKKQNTTEFEPHTHESLGIPTSFELISHKISIVFDPNICSVVANDPKNSDYLLNPFTKNGYLGRADFAEDTIRLWPGNAVFKPSDQRMKRALMEEIMHFVLYSMFLTPEDLKPKTFLHQNEAFVSPIADILTQVLRQVKF